MRVWWAVGVVFLLIASLVGGLGERGLAEPASQSAYILGPGDTIEILVLGDADLSRTVTIKPDGSIALPLVGEVTAAEKTTPQLTAELVTRYSTYLKAPSITVTVREFRIQRVSILGQVIRPGEYPLRPGLTVADLLAAAGGVTSRAALQRAFLVRGSEPIPIDVQKILAGNLEVNLPLSAGDMVIIPELQDRIAVLGAVHRPGAYDLTEGMRLIDALAVAGGQSDGANLDQVAIIRMGTGKTQMISANLGRALRGEDVSQNILLHNGDVVYVQGQGLAQTAQFLTILRVLFGSATYISF